MAEILQGFDFDPLILTTVANFGKLKTFFFWEMTHTFDNFAQCQTLSDVFWEQQIK